MSTQLRRALLAALVAAAAAAAACSSDLDCSLNGVCSPSSVCVCDSPWTGPSCASLGYATTPKAAYDIYNGSDPHNTWGGPIVGPDELGKFHAFIPLYQIGSLSRVITTLHGLADAATGPWDWDALHNISVAATNPAYFAYPDPKTGATVHSLWFANQVFTASSLYGEFVPLPNFSFPFGNAAPMLVDGSIYFTNQHTLQILTTPSIAPGEVWSVYANITVPPLPYTVEDPFMWVDARGNWHIINHAYNKSQTSQCGSSHVSSHFFSEDGKDWHWSDAPYSHVVSYDDGSSKMFVTLERPNIHVDATTGKMTHIVFAADLVTGEDGCGSLGCCDECKFHVHDSTTVVALLQ